MLARSELVDFYCFGYFNSPLGWYGGVLFWKHKQNKMNSNNKVGQSEFKQTAPVNTSKYLSQYKQDKTDV